MKELTSFFPIKGAFHRGITAGELPSALSQRRAEGAEAEALPSPAMGGAAGAYPAGGAEEGGARRRRRPEPAPLVLEPELRRVGELPQEPIGDAARDELDGPGRRRRRHALIAGGVSLVGDGHPPPRPFRRCDGQRRGGADQNRSLHRSLYSIIIFSCKEI